MNKHIVVAVVGIAALIGAYLYGKSQAETITEVKEVEKIVEKRDVVTEIVEIIRPDGTKETVTVIQDKTVIDKLKETETKAGKNNWFVAAGLGYNVNNFERTYQIDVNRRVLGDIFVGVYGSTNKDIGVKVGFEF